MSTPTPYILAPNKSSGERYHLRESKKRGEKEKTQREKGRKSKSRRMRRTGAVGVQQHPPGYTVVEYPPFNYLPMMSEESDQINRSKRTIHSNIKRDLLLVLYTKLTLLLYVVFKMMLHCFM